MKFLLIILLNVFCLKLSGQPLPFERVSYERDSLGKLIRFSAVFNKESSDNYFKKALSYIHNQQADSLKLAYFMLLDLYYYDSSKYSNANLKEYFSQIESNLLSYYSRTIIGNWSFNWSGSNWGTSETSTDKKAKLVFTDTVCYFYLSDTLQRQAKYKITNEFTTPYSKAISFQLYFLDTKDVWDFFFRTEGADYIANLKFDQENIGLFINEMPNCSCGCPESIYLKNGEMNYSIR